MSKTKQNHLTLEDISKKLENLYPAQKRPLAGAKPKKTLKEPGLIIDYYLGQLLDCSDKDRLAIILGKKVEYQGRDRSEIVSGNRLCHYNIKDFKTERLANFKEGFTSLSWQKGGELLTVGYKDGAVEVWDLNAQKMANRWEQKETNHNSSVKTLATHDDWIISGSKKRLVFTDRRSPDAIPLYEQDRPICSVSISAKGTKIVMGSDNNKAYLWSTNRWFEKPIETFKFKASTRGRCHPENDDLYAIGGGTNDRTIRLYNDVNEASCADNTSQVCAIGFFGDRPRSTDIAVGSGFRANPLNVYTPKGKKLVRTEITPPLREDARFDTESRITHLTVTSARNMVIIGKGKMLYFYDVSSPNDASKQDIENMDPNGFRRSIR